MTKIELIRFYSKAIADGMMPAINLAGECQYRMGEKRCAVGVLLSNDQLTVFYELGGVDNLSISATRCAMVFMADIVRRTVPGVSIDDFMQIQLAHDNAARGVEPFRVGFFSRLEELSVFADVPADVWQEVMQ